MRWLQLVALNANSLRCAENQTHQPFQLELNVWPHHLQHNIKCSARSLRIVQYPGSTVAARNSNGNDNDKIQRFKFSSRFLTASQIRQEAMQKITFTFPNKCGRRITLDGRMHGHGMRFIPLSLRKVSERTKHFKSEIQCFHCEKLRFRSCIFAQKVCSIAKVKHSHDEYWSVNVCTSFLYSLHC